MRTVSASAYVLLAIGFFAMSRTVVRYQVYHTARPSDIDSPFVVKVNRTDRGEEEN